VRIPGLVLRDACWRKLLKDEGRKSVMTQKERRR
jgi:hypothetical protein